MINSERFDEKGFIQSEMLTYYYHMVYSFNSR